MSTRNRSSSHTHRSLYSLMRRDPKRSLDAETKRNCWEKAEPVLGLNPNLWRRDPAANLVYRDFNSPNFRGCFSYQYGHTTIRAAVSSDQEMKEGCCAGLTRNGNREGIDVKLLRAVEMATRGQVTAYNPGGILVICKCWNKLQGPPVRCEEKMDYN